MTAYYMPMHKWLLTSFWSKILTQTLDSSDLVQNRRAL